MWIVGAEQSERRRCVTHIDNENIDLLAPFYLSRLVTIGRGSNEIQRNIVSKYVLRLPQSKEARCKHRSSVTTN
jgi:hypothetical protein